MPDAGFGFGSCVKAGFFGAEVNRFGADYVLERGFSLFGGWLGTAAMEFAFEIGEGNFGVADFRDDGLLWGCWGGGVFGAA